MDNTYAQAMAQGFADELKKIANAELQAGKGILSKLLSKETALIGGGAVGALVLSRAERDRQMGSQIRQQQTGY